jgi:hypothetical protein
MSMVDHLVYATRDLARGIDELQDVLGIRATPGGQHSGRGTRNALIALGPDSYIEILAPDPEQPEPSTPRWFGVDGITQSKLATWAAKGTDLERLRATAMQNGIPLGTVARGSRRRPDGVELSWELTDPRASIEDGIVPFFIDWGRSPHPAQSAATGASLIELRAEHPDSQRVQHMLQQVGLPLAVSQSPRAALIATIDCPRGRIALR